MGAAEVPPAGSQTRRRAYRPPQQTTEHPCMVRCRQSALSAALGGRRARGGGGRGGALRRKRPRRRAERRQRSRTTEVPATSLLAGTAREMLYPPSPLCRRARDKQPSGCKYQPPGALPLALELVQPMVHARVLAGASKRGEGVRSMCIQQRKQEPRHPHDVRLTAHWSGKVCARNACSRAALHSPPHSPVATWGTEQLRAEHSSHKLTTHPLLT